MAWAVWTSKSRYEKSPVPFAGPGFFVRSDPPSVDISLPRHRIVDDNDVDPDGFAVWGFEQLLHHRIPLYKAIAQNFGYTVRMRDIPNVQTEAQFIDLVSSAIDQR